MTVSQLQRLDRWIGIPLCFILTIWRSIVRALLQPGSATKPRRLLIVKLAEQGSTVLAYPALVRAIHLVGRENLYFVTFHENRAILDVLDLIPPENVITICERGILRLCATALRALYFSRKLRLDAAISFDFLSRGSTILTYASGARRTVGFYPFFGGGPYCGNLITHKLVYNPQIHTTEAFASLVEAVSYDARTLPTLPVQFLALTTNLPKFMPSESEREHIRNILGSEAARYQQIIVLNPNSSDLLPLRRWPVERYLELNRRLLTMFSEALIVITGNDREAVLAAELARNASSSRCRSVAGKTTLRQLLALYSCADLLITNDSGPAHFASLTPIRVITMFGPETPALFAARTERNKVIWAQLPCSPCVSVYNNRRTSCRINQCMLRISVDEVFSAACAALDAKRTFKEASCGQENLPMDLESTAGLRTH